MKIILIIIVTACIMLALISVLLFINKKNDNDYVAQVNGEKISVLEFRNAMAENRNKIYDYFRQNYDVSDHAGFWKQSVNGEIPIEMLKQKSMEQCARVKIEQILAKQQGIIDDISYQGFLKNLEAENKRRKTAVENNQVIFGPVQYTEEVYFKYVLSNMVISLKDKLQEIEVNDDEIQEYYEENKQLYKIPDTINIERAYILDEQVTVNEELALQALSDIAVKTRQERMSLEVAIAIVSAEKQIPIKFEKRTLDADTARSDSDLEHILLKHSSPLKVGEVSEVIDDEEIFSVIHCISREDVGFTPLEDVRVIIQGILTDQKYEKHIEFLVEAADIKVNEKVYKRVTI